LVRDTSLSWVALITRLLVADLVDEAASQLRLQQESRPEAVEILHRQIVIMKIEMESLRKVQADSVALSSDEVTVGCRRRTRLRVSGWRSCVKVVTVAVAVAANKTTHT
jgi:ATP-dependent Clp protease ATP-binding subunit ClpA